MAIQQGFFEILSDCIINYITRYLNTASIDGIYYIDDQKNDDILPLEKPQNLVREVKPLRFEKEVFSIDGSSRSFISGKGIVSIASVAVTSTSSSIYDVYPSVDGKSKLGLNEPFIAVAASNLESSKLDPYLFSNNYISSVSLSGEPFNPLNGFENIESELRSLLETKALSKLKDKGYIIVDGPLFPSYLYLNGKVKDKIISERIKIIDSNFIGIVKRIDKSQYLVKSLNGEYRKYFVQKFKLDPKSFISDESLLLNLIRFNYNIPYSPIVIGPFLDRVKENINVYINYLVVPFNPYIANFFILRVETLNNNSDIIEKILSLKPTKDGIPYNLALADLTAKKLSAGLYKLIILYLQQLGLQSSFYSRLEVIKS
ncbi:DNA double-strand break repair nuclease NurA [Acidianus brierleyi]|uniref:NurA domain-containing protein n=1 Tax=Acidianus brierleyi TaxID=41673 RepID=A0A2U9IF06_9CREN|nr:DNA double-strand break repair nuclease NurA [Acidianus brierleyi]AWR94627.1 hypothetical protein DFR85_08510 [Acidianus brierleyi]